MVRLVDNHSNTGFHGNHEHGIVLYILSCEGQTLKQYFIAILLLFFTVSCMTPPVVTTLKQDKTQLIESQPDTDAADKDKNTGNMAATEIIFTDNSRIEVENDDIPVAVENQNLILDEDSTNDSREEAPIVSLLYNKKRSVSVKPDDTVIALPEPHGIVTAKIIDNEILHRLLLEISDRGMYPLSVIKGAVKNTRLFQREMYISKTMMNMSIEQKIGQLFVVDVVSSHGGQFATKMNPVLEEWITKYHPGGFIFFKQNIQDIEQTTALIHEIRSLSLIYPFFAIDEEGGTVSRINRSPKMHATPIPDASLIGKTGDSTWAYETGRIIGKEIRSLGFNMNFAPVADILTQGGNKLLQWRSYSSEVGVTAGMVSGFVRGMNEENIISILKHFPGHGDTHYDSHIQKIVVDNHLDILLNRELIPFQAGFKAGAGGVMTAHIYFPNISGETLPATLSPLILDDLLRKTLQFDGLVITDSLGMRGINGSYTPEDICVLAILAGADLLLKPFEMDKAWNAVYTAVTSSQISINRLDQSVRRILEKKAHFLFPTNELAPLDPHTTLGNAEHLSKIELLMKQYETID